VVLHCGISFVLYLTHTNYVIENTYETSDIVLQQSDGRPYPIRSLRFRCICLGYAHYFQDPPMRAFSTASGAGHNVFH
jgi:hypothetical protein